MAKKRSDGALLELTRDAAGMLNAKRDFDYVVLLEGDGVCMYFQNHWRGFSPEHLMNLLNIDGFNGLVVRDNKIVLAFV